ncbi:transposase [Actinoplanes teichomyceticus]|uniref:Transposase n=1 Tax=Actinoplanes teichomyceticus TaxID=1867 RepID=A0A561VMG8_ACTTI|nr:transposase [Actinoplanes teichomyceticus]TWG12792.1 transposase [Actinoplanes teichomyceticus]GIF13531.1 hypothetical protein Ate01nite_35630 [Actinoplanes teichomyceticus]
MNDSPTRAQDNGRKRHLIVDTKGLLMTVKVTRADVTDRDAAREMLPELRKNNPELTLMWADNAYTGLADWARNDLDLTFKVVKKPSNQVGFKVLPRRWIVERSLSWLMRARRNSRDYERLPEHSEAHITWANITLMTRRITRADARRAALPKLIAACPTQGRRHRGRRSSTNSLRAAINSEECAVKSASSSITPST